MRTLAAIAIAALTLTGCCSEEIRTVEVEWGILEELQLATLDSLRGAGFNCRSDGAIRNAFGQRIGTRYVCERCK